MPDSQPSDVPQVPPALPEGTAPSPDAAVPAVAEIATATADPAPESAPAAAPMTAPAPAQGSAQATAQACAEALKGLFPALFQGPPKPLKLRSQADIQARAPGQFSKAQLSAFLRRYTGSHGYLQALTRAPHRFDLDGAAAGEISEEHRQAAVQELQRRRQIVTERRALEDAERDQRARLLRDFERTTLTLPNFLALKGLTAEALEGQLAQARAEAAEPPRGGRPDGRTRPGRHGGPDGREPSRDPRRDAPHGAPREGRSEGPGRPGRPDGARRAGAGRGPARGPSGGGRPPR